MGDFTTFEREARWACEEDAALVRAYADRTQSEAINLEVSLLCVLAESLSGMRPGIDPASLDRLRLEPGGLPYSIPHAPFPRDETAAFVDPTVWDYLVGVSLNPFAPGRTNLGCETAVVPLPWQNQTERFPRFFTPGEDAAGEFPQELNDGDHGAIVVALQDVQGGPAVLELDLVAEDAFEVEVALADDSHCSIGRAGLVERSGQSLTVALDLAPGTSFLVLRGKRGWAVFDQLRFESESGAPSFVIGRADAGCAEFDDEGFSYQCE
jgi:hypothetical protein